MDDSRAPEAGARPGAPLPDDQSASGRSLGDAELARLAEVIASGTLTSTKGSQVKGLEAAFAELLGSAHCVACSSGTAAIHAAIAAVDPEPGEEIVTTPITDMGALAPILYQGAIPVFADVDPVTACVTADSVAAALGERTRAVVVTHLFGRPCDVEAIRDLAGSRGVPVIEDCAQAFLARRGSRLVGTIGTAGCFSTQQGKHITSGEGGLIVTDDEVLARRVRRYVNKAWDYDAESTDHDFLALNYRMTELQGAVLNAQLEKLGEGVARRVEAARRLNDRLSDVRGLDVPEPDRGDVHTYWRYALGVDPFLVPGGPAAVAAELRPLGIASAPRYIRKPAFACGVFVDQKTFGRSRWPFTLARPETLDYDPARYPGTFAALERLLVLPWNERYTDRDVDRVADAVATAVGRVQGAAA